MRPVWCLFVACVLAAGCGSESEPDNEANVLSGSVKLDGKPVEYVMLYAVGTDGKEVSGPRRADGSYRIVNPPTGALKFKFAGGPPIPGGPATMKTGNVPARYLSANNELKFEYSGGKKTYDIELKP